MDKSLDDIISSKPRGVRRTSSRRGSARAHILGKPAPSPATRVRAAASAAAAGVKVPAAQPSPADKIVVSNLPQDVNEVQIKELFHSTVGPLKEVTLHYDSAGRSKGVAAVHFQRKGDGTKAYTQYNNRLIDGKRPMKIEIIVDPARPLSLASRVAPAVTPSATNAAQVPRTGGGPRRRGRGGKGRRAERLPKSAADLDAEMEDYTASNAPTATAA
jgi:THO complex subunit 4